MYSPQNRVALFVPTEYLVIECLFKNYTKHDANIKVQKCFSCPHQEGINGSIEVKLHSFLTCALDGARIQFHAVAVSSPIYIKLWFGLVNKANLVHSFY